MKTVLSLLFIVGMISQMDAQRYRNPQQYLRQFSNENRKINKKNLLYLKASLKGEDERRVSKYREMVIEQLKDSKKEIERTGPYEDYEILQREYVDGLQLFIDAYENNFGIAQELRDSMYNSYDDLKKYYDAVTKAEGKMIEASYKLEKAEDHFAKTYYIEVRRDEEVQREYILLDEVTLYARDMTLSFFRVDQQVRDYLKAIENDQMDTLGYILTNMRKAIKESQQEVAEYADFAGEDDLYEEVRYYLEEVNEEIDETLRPVTDILQNQYADPKEYREAEKNLKSFIKRHSGRVKDFFETKRELIEDYLPE